MAGRNRRLLTRRRLIIGGICLALLTFIFWLNYPFLPDFKILLFNRPTTDLTSNSRPGQWAMEGGDVAQAKAVRSGDPAAGAPAGETLWNVDLGPPSRSGPIVSGQRVILGGHFQVTALDAADGAVLWQKATTGPVPGSLAAAGDRLYMGLLDHRLLAMDAATGETLWEFQAQDLLTSAPVVHKGILYFGSWDGRLYALDAANGAPIWTYQATDSLGAPPAIREGVLAVGDRNGRMHLINARTGQNRLVFRTPKSAYAPPALAHDMAYYAAGGRLYAIDATEKEIPGQYQFKRVWAQLWLWKVPGVPPPAGQQGGRWRFSPDGAESSIVASPAVTNTSLYVGDLQGRLYAVDPVSGEELWRFEAQGGIYASPVVVDQRVYIATQEGWLYAVDAGDGQPLWQLSLNSPVNQPLAYANGHFYLRTDDGRLHAIK